MKKDRDCGMPYPIYPPYQGIMPPNMMPQPMMNYQSYSMPNQSNMNNIEQQLNNIEQEINNLDRRISNLENIYNNSNKYGSSNYQMM